MIASLIASMITSMIASMNTFSDFPCERDRPIARCRCRRESLMQSFVKDSRFVFTIGGQVKEMFRTTTIMIDGTLLKCRQSKQIWRTSQRNVQSRKCSGPQLQCAANHGLNSENLDQQAAAAGSGVCSEVKKAGVTKIQKLSEELR